LWETLEKLKEKRKNRQCEAEGPTLCFALLFSSGILSDFLLEKLGTDSTGKHSCMELADIESERENH